MKKKGGWFSAVRKAFNPSSSNDSKEKNEKKPQKTASSKSWFGSQTTVEADSPQPETAFATPAVLSPPTDQEDDVKVSEQQAETSENTEQDNKPSNNAIPEHEPEKPVNPENEPSKPAKQEVEQKKPTKTENEPSKSRAAVVAAAFRRILGKSKEEVAAIKIQTAFRRFSARKKLRALKGLVRLKVLVQSQSVKRQAITTLRCMQTLARVQSQVRARRIRMSEENQALQRQLMQKRERELDNTKYYLGTEWDNTRRSKEQIVATMQKKEEATALRERALAYAHTQQQMWKNPSKSANPTFMDPNNPQWGWSWLDRWMASRPWESQTSAPVEDEQPPAKLTRSSSFGDKSQKLERLPSMSSPRSPSVSNRRLTLSSPKSIITDPAPSPRNRRHSISNSSFREDSMTLVSSPRVSSPRVSSPRVNSSRSTKTKSMVPTPTRSPSRSPSPSPLGSGKKGTVEKKPTTGSANRRLSLSGAASSGASSTNRRLSLSGTQSSGGSGTNRRLSLSGTPSAGGGGGGGNRRLSMSSRVGSGYR